MDNITNCPNCGAPVDLAEKSCPYCDTPYKRNTPAGLIDPDIRLIMDTERLCAAVAAGTMTPNEARRLLGMREL